MILWKYNLAYFLKMWMTSLIDSEISRSQTGSNIDTQWMFAEWVNWFNTVTSMEIQDFLTFLHHFQILGDFLVILLWLVYSLMVLYSDNTFCKISLDVVRLTLWPNLGSIWVNLTSELEANLSPKLIESSWLKLVN